MAIINALGSLDDPNLPEGLARVLTARVITDARASGLTAVNCTLGYVAGEQDPFESSVAEIGIYDEKIRENRNDLIKILSAADILRAREQQKIGVIYGFQNAVQLGEDPSRVRTFGDLGVRIIQLTYNGQNGLGNGATVPADAGLTPFGREVIAQLNVNRMMVDLSHSGRQTCLDAIRVSKQPISINHTGCRAIADLPRNKTDDELRQVADRGGFVGIYFMPFLSSSGHPTSTDVIAHIEHAIDVCGEEHVGIGTDGGTTPVDDLDHYKIALGKEYAERKAQGISAPGEGADIHPFVDDLRGPEQFRKLYRLMAQRGHTATRIEKVLGGNFLRYCGDVWSN